MSDVPVVSRDWDALTVALRAQFNLVEETAAAGEWLFSLLHPRSADDLISEEDFDLDERLPYWAEIWPSAQALVARLATERGNGRRLLELGCGAGLTAITAVRAGFDVLASDYYAEALDFTQLNAVRNGLPPPAVRLIDWRAMPADLGQFEIVAAADVLYEKPYAELVARTIRQTLAPGGTALVTDPRRPGARRFPDACRACGLTVEIDERSALGLKGPQAIDLFTLRHA